MATKKALLAKLAAVKGGWHPCLVRGCAVSDAGPPLAANIKEQTNQLPNAHDDTGGMASSQQYSAPVRRVAPASPAAVKSQARGAVSQAQARAQEQAQEEAQEAQEAQQAQTDDTHMTASEPLVEPAPAPSVPEVTPAEAESITPDALEAASELPAPAPVPAPSTDTRMQQIITKLLCKTFVLPFQLVGGQVRIQATWILGLVFIPMLFVPLCGTLSTTPDPNPAVVVSCSCYPCGSLVPTTSFGGCEAPTQQCSSSANIYPANICWSSEACDLSDCNCASHTCWHAQESKSTSIVTDVCEASPWSFGLILFVLVTVIIFLHEMGHAVAFGIVGVPVVSTTFGALGAFVTPCQYFYTFLSPAKIGFVSFAGPLVNLALAAAAYPLLSTLDLVDLNFGGTILLMSFAFNASLFVFNMLPIGAFDGAKVAMSLFTCCMTRRHARLATACTGLVFAIPVSIFLSSIGDWMGLSFIALMVLLVVLQLWQYHKGRAEKNKLRVGDLVVTKVGGVGSASFWEKSASDNVHVLKRETMPLPASRESSAAKHVSSMSIAKAGMKGRVIEVCDVLGTALVAFDATQTSVPFWVHEHPDYAKLMLLNAQIRIRRCTLDAPH
jgi:Zn-dependent protease